MAMTRKPMLCCASTAEVGWVRWCSVMVKRVARGLAWSLRDDEGKGRESLAPSVMAPVKTRKAMPRVEAWPWQALAARSAATSAGALVAGDLALAEKLLVARHRALGM